MSALLMVGAVAYAQPAEPDKAKHVKHMEQMRTEKIGFLTERLALTPEEAQVFWPVYNAYEKEMMEAGKAVRDARKALRPAKEQKDQAEPSEKEVKARIDDYLKALKAEAEIKAKYNGQFMKVLPAVKVAKLYMVEEHFQNKMLREMFKRQAEMHGKQGNRPDGAKAPKAPKGPRFGKKAKDVKENNAAKEVQEAK